MFAKVLVTGGSGFVGTNLIEFLSRKQYEVINVDIQAPKNPYHTQFWRQADICNKPQISDFIQSFSPDYIIHLAARTDLKGLVLDDYKANTLGVESVIDAAINLPNIKRIVFASSMLVCPLGYKPKDDLDFSPTTIYGESKAIGEKIVRSLASEKLKWIIVRPTSLWGPWFGVPYKLFFDAVAQGRYLHPRSKRIHRSYGFVYNAVEALEKLMIYNEELAVNRRVFYLADYEPVELYSWACMISNAFGVSAPKEVPLFLLKTLASAGDLMKFLGNDNPPLSSFRLNNLLTDGVYDLSPLKSIAGQSTYKLNDAVLETVKWMTFQQSSKKG